MAQKGERRYEATPLFVRVNEKELRVIEAAVKIKYGRVQGNKSEFIRQAVLREAVNVIKEHKRKQGED